MSTSAHLPEAAAKRVLMLRAFEVASTESPLWTTDDRAWATRLARETGADKAKPVPALVQRAEHAMQRLVPRDAAIGKRLARQMWSTAWVPVVLVLAFATGMAVDAIGGSQRINLLAPPVWVVIVWNLAVYLGLLLPKPKPKPELPRGLRAWLARRLIGGGGGLGSAHTPLRAYAADWAKASLPLAAARAGVLLHVAAAALAVGLLAGMYIRGLVLDYRAGWESTFLDASAVQTGLSVLLLPATTLTGIAVPDVAGIEALRVGPGIIATASAADWIHLYAAMLALFVVLPRLLLAVLAGTRALVRSRRVPLALEEPYFQRLLHELRDAPAVAQVLPHGAGPSAKATLGLREWLVAACGPSLQLHLAEPTAYGQEDAASLPDAEPDATLRVVLVDLASTPEADTQGRFIEALKAQSGAGYGPAAQLLVLADETDFRRRFGQMPERVAERRAAWQNFAASHGAGFVGVGLEQIDAASAQADLQAALQPALMLK